MLGVLLEQHIVEAVHHNELHSRRPHVKSHSQHIVWVYTRHAYVAVSRDVFFLQVKRSRKRKRKIILIFKKIICWCSLRFLSFVDLLREFHLQLWKKKNTFPKKGQQKEPERKAKCIFSRKKSAVINLSLEIFSTP
jgi:hypothetical protein